MRRLLPLMLLASLLAPPHAAAAQARRPPADALAADRRPAKESVRLRARGRRIVLTAGGRAHTLDLGDKISSARLEAVELLFLTRREGFVYLVADARGPSKLKSDMRQCGAGEEFDLVWMKLTADWRLADAQSARYESCWGSATSEDGYKIEKNLLHLSYSDFGSKREVQLTYDADRPESGFQIKESEMKDQ